MKFALHMNCSKKYLLDADEIIVYYKDKDKIMDFPEKYPNKPITIQCFNEDIGDIDWEWCSSISKVFPQGFSMGFINIVSLREALNRNIKAYMLKTINSFMELDYLRSIGVCQVYLDEPLFFSIDKVKSFGIPVRYIPNLVDSSPGYLQRASHGTWIRPEDLDMYDFEGCIAEFQGIHVKGEMAYFRVYKEQKEWLGRFNLLLPDLQGYDVDNFLLESELTEKRLNCNHKCESVPNGEGCYLCDTAFDLARRELVTDYIESIKNKQLETDPIPVN